MQVQCMPEKVVDTSQEMHIMHMKKEREFDDSQLYHFGRYPTIGLESYWKSIDLTVKHWDSFIATKKFKKNFQQACKIPQSGNGREFGIAKHLSIFNKFVSEQHRKYVRRSAGLGRETSRDRYHWTSNNHKLQRFKLPSFVHVSHKR